MAHVLESLSPLVALIHPLAQPGRWSFHPVRFHSREFYSVHRHPDTNGYGLLHPMKCVTVFLSSLLQSRVLN